MYAIIRLVWYMLVKRIISFLVSVTHTAVLTVRVDHLSSEGAYDRCARVGFPKMGVDRSRENRYEPADLPAGQPVIHSLWVRV